MRGTTVFILVLIAFAVGVVGAILLRNGQQATTATVVSLPGDADGDGLGDEVDYYPNDPLQ